MLDWIAANQSVLQVVVAIASAVIWLVYLQLFFVSFMRQRRTEILINRGPGAGMQARCYIANLGFEPIYVAQLLMTVTTGDEVVDAAVTDRVLLSEDQQRDPSHATNQGPLRSGDSYDAGTFDELVGRALSVAGRDEAATVDGFDLTVVAIHAASSDFVGATRHFDVIARDGQREPMPNDIVTRQLRSPFARRRLRTRLLRDLGWYRS
jgi:hypothetical protein